MRSLSWRIFGRSLKIFKDLQRSCDDFHQGRYQNVQCFTLEHVHEPKIGLVLFVVVFFFAGVIRLLFSCPFPFLFLSPFSHASFCSSYPFWQPKKFDCWLYFKPGNGTLINFRCNGPFYHQFCTRSCSQFLSYHFVKKNTS